MSPSRRTPGPAPSPVATGAAELLRDIDDDGVVLLVDGVPQSHVDPEDPTYLAFEYVRRLGHVADLCAEAGTPVDALHLGGGALTLPRYVAATRPGSRQRVLELDAALTDLVRRELPLDRTARVRVRAVDAAEGTRSLPDGSADLVIGDVYAGARVPAHLTTVEHLAQVARVLRSSGTYAANIADGPPLGFVKGQVATVRTLLPEVALLVEPAVWRGRRFGNVVLVASRRPLPLDALSRRCAGDPAPARVVAGLDLDRWVGQAPLVTSATAEDSPLPPEAVFAR